MNSEKVLLSFNRTRKAFLVEYLCALFFLALALLSYKQALPFGADLQSRAAPWFFIATILIIVYIEYACLSFHLEITSNKVTIRDGIMNQSKAHLMAFTITDIEVNQSYWQSIFDYGDLVIFSASGEQRRIIKDINHPHDAVRELEKLVHSNVPQKSSNAGRM